MSYFTEIEGDAAILASRGTYRQAALYSWDGHLFAKSGGGFVRLAADGSTSKSDMRIVRLITDIALYRDPLGRLTIKQTGGAKPLPGENRQALLAAPAE